MSQPPTRLIAVPPGESIALICKLHTQLQCSVDVLQEALPQEYYIVREGQLAEAYT